MKEEEILRKFNLTADDIDVQMDITTRAYKTRVFCLNNDKKISDDDFDDRKILEDIIRKKLQSGEVDPVDGMVLNLDWDPAEMSEDMEERKAQLKNMVETFFLYKRLAKKKDLMSDKPNFSKKDLKELEKAEKLVKESIEKVAVIKSQEESIFDNHYLKDEEVLIRQKELDENIEKLKFQNGDNYVKYTRAVEPFILDCKKGLERYRKQIVEYKNIKQTISLEEKKFKKAVEQYQVALAKIDKNPILYDIGKDFKPFEIPQEQVLSDIKLIKTKVDERLPLMEAKMNSSRRKFSESDLKFKTIQSCISLNKF